MHQYQPCEGTHGQWHKRALSSSTAWKHSFLISFLLFFALFQSIVALATDDHSRVLARRSTFGKRRLIIRQAQTQDEDSGSGEVSTVTTTATASTLEDALSSTLSESTIALTASESSVDLETSTSNDVPTSTFTTEPDIVATSTLTFTSQTTFHTTSTLASSSSLETLSDSVSVAETTSEIDATTITTSTPLPSATTKQADDRGKQDLIPFLFNKKDNKFFAAVIAGCVLLGIGVILIFLAVLRFIAQRKYAASQRRLHAKSMLEANFSWDAVEQNEKVSPRETALPEALFNQPFARLADNDSLLFLERNDAGPPQSIVYAAPPKSRKNRPVVPPKAGAMYYQEYIESSNSAWRGQGMGLPSSNYVEPQYPAMAATDEAAWRNALSPFNRGPSHSQSRQRHERERRRERRAETSEPSMAVIDPVFEDNMGQVENPRAVTKLTHVAEIDFRRKRSEREVKGDIKVTKERKITKRRT